MTIGLLDDDMPPSRQPVLPATLDAGAETLLLRRRIADDRIQVLRLWRAPEQFRDGTPLWIGTTQTLAYTRPFDILGLWQPQADTRDAYVSLRAALAGFQTREGLHPESGTPVLRLRTTTAE
jgi:hypothetical protein